MDPKKWTFISRELVLSHPRITLVEDQVELPDGSKTSYLREAPAVKQSVAIVAANDNAEILLQREYSYPPDEVMWQLPGGTVEDEEDVLEAANRELSEESGFIAEGMQKLGYVYTNNRRSNQKQHVVLCTKLKEQKAQEDPEEFIRSEWVSVDVLKQKIRDGEVHNINLLAAVNLWLLNSEIA